MSEATIQWCPTYLRSELHVGATMQPTTVVRLRRGAAVVLTEEPVTVGASVTLKIFPEPEVPPLATEGKVLEVTPRRSLAGLQEVLDPPVPTAEIEFENPSDAVLELLSRELDAQGAGRRVAVVDDEPLMLWMLQSVLRTVGLEAICIHDPRGAVNVILEATPRLILLDLNMPHLPGRELCRLLKEDARTSGVPVLLVSAEPAERLAEAALEVGADGFLEKGADLADLVTQVRRHLDE